MSRFITFISVCGYLLLSEMMTAQNPVNPFKAPLYWNVYENNYLQSKANVANNYISEADLLANINWVDANLKPFGYNIICIDGWGDVDYNQYGYRTKHSSAWVHDYAWWSAFLQSKAMTLGMYDNPLWVNKNAANAGIKVKGTNILLSSLINTSENATWFNWLQVDRPGAKEYLKGYVQHYADMGVKYFRVDFLSWYESGWDRYMGTVGPVRTLANYQTALQWMREACDANGMFLSLVMPNLNNDAVSEQKYGHMIRIDEDCAEGTWTRFSDNARAVKRSGWSQYANPFDGFIYWSKITGKGKMIPDGDFIRLNTYSNDEERKAVVSLHLMAGATVSVADQYNSIGNSLWIYQNEELLALNADGFVGKPLSADPTNALSQVWKGQLTNGDWIVGFFNRETTTQTRTINPASDLGLSGNVFVRDLWSHSDLGSLSSLSQPVASHACQIYRISANASKVISPLASQKSGTFNGSCIVSLSTTTSGATIYYTLDGSTPGSASQKYSNPIAITASSTLRAIAIKQGMADSYISKESYTINIPAPQAAMYIGGTFNAWNLPTLPMNYSGNNSWQSNQVSIAAGNHEMKFANSSDWSGIDWGSASGLAAYAKVSTGGQPNITFSIPTTANYTLSFNDATLAYSINNTLTGFSETGNSNVRVSTVKSLYQLVVDFDKNENAQIEVFGMSGQMLYKMRSDLKKNVICLGSEMQSSILLVRVVTDSETATFKVLF